MTELKKGDYVEGKGYFVGHLCQHCGREAGLHFASGKNCQGDQRSINPARLETIYTPDLKKPVFVKFIL